MGDAVIIKGYRVEALAKCVGKEVLADDVLGLSAELAYYFFFSLFPIMLFITPVLSFFGNEQEIVNWVLTQLGHAIPPEAQALVADVIRSVVTTNAPGLMSVGALLALWAGSNVFNNLINALNKAYDVEETRPFWKRRLLAMGMVVLAGLVVGTATITVVAGEYIIDWVGRILGVAESTRSTLTIVQYTLSLLFLIGMAWMTYRLLPNTRQSGWHLLVGAVFTTVTWVIVTLGFKLYVVNFGNYSATYGTIGAIIVLLTWMYLTMVVLLTGGELASELHKGTASVATRGGKLFGGRISSGGSVDLASTDRIEHVMPPPSRA
jgi:membrane protein